MSVSLCVRVRGAPFASRAEGQAGACRGDEQPARHLLAHGLGEVQAAAMHRDDDVRFERLQFGDRLRDVGNRRRPQMEPADQGVELIHA